MSQCVPFRRASSASCWNSKTLTIALSRELSDGLRRTAAGFGTTPFTLAMASFKALLHRYSGLNDIVLGTMVSNRTAETRGVLGPVQNPALIRDEVHSENTIRDLTRSVSRSLAAAQENGDAPLERSFGSGVQFISHDHAGRRIEIAGARLEPVVVTQDESPFELCVAASTAEPRVRLEFEHRPSVYSSEAVDRMARQYVALLESVVRAPRSSVGELSFLSSDEARALARRAAAPMKNREELLHAGFEASARRAPAAVAIATLGGRITYGELDAEAGRLADKLTGFGAGAGDLVAVSLPKGPAQVVACLAALKAGAAYVPVDPSLPKARRDELLARGFRAIVDSDGARRLGAPIRRRPRGPRPSSLAYVIFTSGSTGTPKGVMITHRQAMTTIAEISRRFEVGSRDRVLAVSSLGFDLSVYDIFGVLRAGGTVVMPSGSDPAEWLELCVRERVTIWNSAPCLLELLLDEARSRDLRLDIPRLALLSGDFISLALARRALSELPAAKLVSLGGATEGSIWSIARVVDAVDPYWRSVPYGRALRGQEIYVLDQSLRHCPIGATGELYIAGAGVAKGYWRDRKETSARFLRRGGLGRIYRTGDLGRYLEDGEIEILGRVDDQVKIDGVRIELGEVEAAICSSPRVRQALADVRPLPGGGKSLVAFVAASPGTTAADIVVHVRKRLPAALLPSAYAVLERLPLTSNGKVDRAALRAQEPAPLGPAAPIDDPAERWIADLWSELLGGTAVGADDDFFSLGGHSLLAIKMVQRVRAHFGAELPLSMVVERPTVRGLAAAVRASADGLAEIGLPRVSIDRLERDAELELPTKLLQVSDAEDVLLTGATGHLGAALLAELIRRPGGRILCLIRARAPEDGHSRLAATLVARGIAPGRAVAVPGDLGKRDLGMSPAAFASLAQSVRAVYHCAAEVNFAARYEQLAPGNVGGTREMIRLAAVGGAVLHHVSSVAVFPYGGGRVRREDDDIARGETLRGGYAQSKWVAERMVWNAVKHGLRAVVFRPAQIVGRNPGDGPHDLYDHVVTACRIVRAIPDIDAEMDMVTSDFAAAAIAALSEDAGSLGRAFHLVNPRPIALRDFAARMSRPLPVIPLEAWLNRVAAEAARLEDPSLQLVSMLASGLERADLTPPAIDCSAATASLRRAGIECPPIEAP